MSPEEDHALVRRVYSAKGKKYPLLMITIHPDVDHAIHKEPLMGIRIGVATKEKKGDWWDDYMAFIPLELFSDLEEMLAEVKKKSQ